MTNLKFHKDEILRETTKSDSLICAICIAKNKECVNGINEECPFEKDLFNWLCEEYKERIRLKHWEYNLIKLYIEESVFCENPTLSKMKDKGYFKGVYDTSLTVKEILDNYEIVNDYYGHF